MLVIQQRLAPVHARIERVVRNRGEIFNDRPAVEPGADIRDSRVALDRRVVIPVHDLGRLPGTRQR